MEIITGKQERPQKEVFYGSEGIGKTTMASMCPDPIFIDTEGGTGHLDVKRTPPVKSIDDIEKYILEIVSAASLGDPVCKTVVIDTADWAEAMIINKVCEEKHLNSIEDAGFGKGYVYVAERFKIFLNHLDKCIDAGMNVVVTAHAAMRKFEQPDEMGSYDRWELKLSKKTAPLLKEWCDDLLFLNYKTTVVTTAEKTKKATGGKRIIYTQHRPCWDAKNRHGLADELPMEYASIAPIFASTESTVTSIDTSTTPTDTPIEKSLVDELCEKIKAEGLEQTDIERVVVNRKKAPDGTKIADYSDDIIKWIFKFWPKVKEMAELPF